MKAHGNAAPELCAANLLRIVRGEVPFDRVRGVDSELIDKPNVADEVAADAEWVIENYEPRVNVDSITTDEDGALVGDFSALLTIEREEDEEEWQS